MIQKVKRSINGYVVIAFCVVVICVSFVLCRNADVELQNQRSAYQSASSRVDALGKDKTAKTERLRLLDDPAYIEYFARTEYGYVSQNELCFVIRNPERLYGDEMPSP